MAQQRPQRGRRHVVAELEAAGPAGALSCDIVAHAVGLHPEYVRETLVKMKREGAIVSRLAPGEARRGRAYRYYLPQHAPDESTAPPARPHFNAVANSRLVLDHRQPTIVPPGVRVTQCPSSLDTRFTVAPGERVVGLGLAAEWRARRRAGAKAARA